MKKKLGLATLGLLLSGAAAFAGGAAFTTALPTGFVGHGVGCTAGTSGVKGGNGKHGAQI